MKTYSTLYGVIFTLLVTSSCREELCYDHPHNGKVEIVVDWKHLPEGIAVPSGVKVGAYGSTDGVSVDQFHLSSEGGTRVLGQGTFHFMLYNNNTQTIYFRGLEVWAKAEAYLAQTTQASYNKIPVNRASGSKVESRSGSYPADALYVGDQKGVLVGAFQTENQKVVIEPKSVVKSVVVRVQLVGLKNVSQARGYLTGCSESINLPTRAISQTPTTVLFDYRSATGSELQARFNVFGMVDKEKIPEGYKVGLELILLDGQYLKYDFDIEGQINELFKVQGGVLVIPQTIIVPDIEQPTGNAGFEPGIGSWDKELNVFL